MKACTRCHGVDIIFSQRRSPNEWSEVVSAMVGNGMALTDAEYSGILAYLSEHLTRPAAK